MLLCLVECLLLLLLSECLRCFLLLFSRNVCSYEVFEKLTAFVMAYSFTDEGAGFLGQTMMVPFVDLLNHSSRHHVELTFHPNHLQLQAVRDIKKVKGYSEWVCRYGQSVCEVSTRMSGLAGGHIK